MEIFTRAEWRERLPVPVNPLLGVWKHWPCSWISFSQNELKSQELGTSIQEKLPIHHLLDHLALCDRLTLWKAREHWGTGTGAWFQCSHFWSHTHSEFSLNMEFFRPALQRSRTHTHMPFPQQECLFCDSKGNAIRCLSSIY